MVYHSVPRRLLICIFNIANVDRYDDVLMCIYLNYVSKSACSSWIVLNVIFFVFFRVLQSIHVSKFHLILFFCILSQGVLCHMIHQSNNITFDQAPQQIVLCELHLLFSCCCYCCYHSFFIWFKISPLFILF